MNSHADRDRQQRQEQTPARHDPGSRQGFYPIGSSTAVDEFLKQQFDIDVSKDFRFGRHEVLEWTNHGGQSRVFKARDLDLDRVVAIKYYHGAIDERQKARVLAEGQALAKIDHPYVARCHHVATSAGAPFLVLEWVEGETLDKYLELNDLGFAKKRILFGKIAEGVQALHSQNLLHSDLKPNNVIITPGGGPKIIDLGLTQNIGQIKEGVVGTYSFMAPEVARHEIGNVGVSTDIFGLGGILYYMLTGQAVYSADSRSETISLAKECQIIAPRDINPGVPDDLDELCKSCLNEKPGERVADVQSLTQRLNSFVRARQRRQIWLALLGLVVLVGAVSFLMPWNSRPEFSAEVGLIMQSLNGLTDQEYAEVEKATHELLEAESILANESSGDVSEYPIALSHAKTALSKIGFATDGKEWKTLQPDLLKLRWRILDNLIKCKVRVQDRAGLLPLAEEMIKSATYLFGPDSDQVYTATGYRCEIHLGHGHPSLAIDDITRLYHRAKELNDVENRNHNLVMLLNACYQMKNYERIQELSKSSVIKDPPVSGEAFNLAKSRVFVGRAYFKSGDPAVGKQWIDLALESLRSCLTSGNSVPPQLIKLNIGIANFALARMESELGNHEIAIEATREAIELYEEVQPNTLHRPWIENARAHLAAGDFGAARHSLDTFAKPLVESQQFSGGRYLNTVQAEIATLSGDIEFADRNFEAAKTHYVEAGERFREATSDSTIASLTTRVRLVETLLQICKSSPDVVSEAQSTISSLKEKIELETGKSSISRGMQNELLGLLTRVENASSSLTEYE